RLLDLGQRHQRPRGRPRTHGRPRARALRRAVGAKEHRARQALMPTRNGAAWPRRVVAELRAMKRSLLWAALPLCGCSVFWPAPTPMRALDYVAARPPARCLVVFLPGLGDEAEDFAKQGLVVEVQKRKLSIDVVAANATFGYYVKGS